MHARRVVCSPSLNSRRPTCDARHATGRVAETEEDVDTTSDPGGGGHRQCDQGTGVSARTWAWSSSSLKASSNKACSPHPSSLPRIPCFPRSSAPYSALAASAFPNVVEHRCASVHCQDETQIRGTHLHLHLHPASRVPAYHHSIFHIQRFTSLCTLPTQLTSSALASG